MEFITRKKLKEMLLGILLIGISVGCYRMSMFGVDAFACMNLGVCAVVGLSFGTWQLIVNIIILVVVFFTIRENIGLGTIVNMVFVGYIADFMCWLLQDVAGLEAGLLLRIVFLAIGMLLASLGCALYLHAKLGVSPYDSVAFIVTKISKDHISFRAARVLSDVTAVAIGVSVCWMAHHNIWEIVGLGTILNALCNGPLIQYFQTKLEKGL